MSSAKYVIISEKDEKTGKRINNGKKRNGKKEKKKKKKRKNK